MHVRGIVARVLGSCLTGMHAKRVKALLRATAGLLCGGKATLSAIALYLGGNIGYKHRLKSVDRLLSNGALQQMRAILYRRLAQRWLVGPRQYLVVVDWSDLTLNQRWQLLRASVVVEGRSITLYEEVHAQSQLGNPRVHQAFMRRLRDMVPDGCRLIVMTDAGFHSPWFRLVEEQGWGFIGRVRGCNRLRFGQDGPWIAARDLYGCAGVEVRDLGMGEYARSNPVAVRAVIAKRPPKGRHRLNRYGAKRRSRASVRNARAAYEPWLLVSSPSLRHLSARSVVGLYAQRMRIEQAFRDTKNGRVGLGLEFARSRSAARFEMLLLLAHLASFVQRLIGECAKNRQLELQFMARRRATSPEISALTLARRILDTSPCCLSRLTPWRAMVSLAEQAASACVVPA